MDSKFSRLQNFVNASKTGSSLTTNNNENDRSGSRSIFSRDLFQINVDRVQNFFNKRINSINDGAPSSSDDMQVLLQKGDNDPILPSLVRLSFTLQFIISFNFNLILES
jgi:hypothetical protein